MEETIIDHGRIFDFGRTSEQYAKYRDIYTDEIFNKLHELGIGRESSKWLDLGTGTGVIPRGLAKYNADITALDIAENQIEQAKVLSKGIKNIHYMACSAEEINFSEKYFDAITACQCFWYFKSDVIVPKIKSWLKEDGVFLKLYMTYDAKTDEIGNTSWAIVKKINTDWTSGSAVKDLTTYYFKEPQMESMIINIPFTRESWHGRMLASRGVMASMNEEMLKTFNKMHWEYMQSLPENFTVRHKVFFTWYYPNKNSV